MLLLPSLPGGFGRPSGLAPNHPVEGRKGLQGEGGRELLPVVCYQIVPKLLKWRRSSQLQRQKTQTNECPTPK